MELKTDFYCNPASLPDLPLGMDRIYPGWQARGYTGKPCDYRELADPEVLPFEGKYYAYIVKMSSSDNVLSKLKIKGLLHANIYPTKKRAAAVVEAWNASYKSNGTYLFDCPGF